MSIGVPLTGRAWSLLCLLSTIRVHTRENQYPAPVNQLKKKKQKLWQIHKLHSLNLVSGLNDKRTPDPLDVPKGRKNNCAGFLWPNYKAAQHVSFTVKITSECISCKIQDQFKKYDCLYTKLNPVRSLIKKENLYFNAICICIFQYVFVL